MRRKCFQFLRMINANFFTGKVLSKAQFSFHHPSHRFADVSSVDTRQCTQQNVTKLQARFTVHPVHKEQKVHIHPEMSGTQDSEDRDSDALYCITNPCDLTALIHKAAAKVAWRIRFLRALQIN